MIWAPTMRQLVNIVNSSSWSIFQIAIAFFVLLHFSFYRIFRSSHISFYRTFRSIAYFIPTATFHSNRFQWHSILFLFQILICFFVLLKQQNWVTNVNLWFANFKLYCKSMFSSIAMNMGMDINKNIYEIFLNTKRKYFILFASSNSFSIRKKLMKN